MLMYHKLSNAGLCGQTEQSSGVITAGTVQIMLCDGMTVVSGLTQKFPVAYFHGGHKFVMFSLKIGGQHWSFAVLFCWPPGHKAGGWR